MAVLLPFWIISVIASLGMWERKSWVRHLLAAYLSLPCFVFIYAALMIPDYWLLTIPVTIFFSLVWYLYWKSSTIAFFEMEKSNAR